MLCPNFFDCFVAFVLHCRIIQPALAVLVHNPLLQPCKSGVLKAFVLGYMRLLNHCNFGVQPSAHVVFIPLRNVHIIVHRLLFRGGYGACHKLCIQVRLLCVHVRLYVVCGIAVLCNRGSAGHNFGILAYKRVRVDIFIGFQKVCIAVKVVKVLQQRKIKCFYIVFVRFVAGKHGGKVNGKLFVGNSCFKNAFVNRLQAAYALLLLLFLTAHNRQSR